MDQHSDEASKESNMIQLSFRQGQKEQEISAYGSATQSALGAADAELEENRGQGSHCIAGVLERTEESCHDELSFPDTV